MATVKQFSSNGEIQLSPHFYLSELTVSDKAVRMGLSNTPDPIAVANLFKMAALMEEVRKVLGSRPISVSSGYRSPAVNKAVGGSRTSDHLSGSACDFICPGFGSPLEICRALVKAGVKFGQLIEEGNWTHISLPNRGEKNGEVLTARFVKGKATYVRGLR